MSLPIRHLPLIQNWDCQECGNCCREYQISVTDDERSTIEANGWATDPAIGGRPLFVATGPLWSRRYVLNHRQDGSCVFLNPQNRCMLHERFGAAAKPFPCRLYPFVLIPAGDHWRVGLRFACPSAAANQGKPLSEALSELHRYTDDMERRSAVQAEEVRPPPLTAGHTTSWPDVSRFVSAILALLGNRKDRFERRMRKSLALANLCLHARFEQVSGARLGEFLHVVTSSLAEEVPINPASLEKPSWYAQLLFRQALAIYARKDQGPNRGLVRGRIALALAAWKFTRGRGTVPRLHSWLPDTTFQDVENMRGVLSPAVDEVLERYYTVKISSLQFCGSGHFGFPFWEGFQALALTLPVILWLTRALNQAYPEDAVIRAIGMADRNYGFNRVLGMRRQRIALSLLARDRNLARLIGWYSR